MSKLRLIARPSQFRLGSGFTGTEVDVGPSLSGITSTYGLPSNVAYFLTTCPFWNRSSYTALALSPRVLNSARFSTSSLARIHRRTSLGTALEEAGGCPSESGIMVLEQKPARKQGAPK